MFKEETSTIIRLCQYGSIVWWAASLSEDRYVYLPTAAVNAEQLQQQLRIPGH